jgi:small subunit ribosomal protein S19
MVKEETYQGKTLEELQKMSREEFTKLVNARARKTLLKTKDEHMQKKIEKARQELNAKKYPKPIRTHKRNTIIEPNMIGLNFAIHNGKEFITITPTIKMIGHYMGEFALTRKRLVHGKAGIGSTKSSTAITARG